MRTSERWSDRIEKTDGCWEWRGRRCRGYGEATVGGRKGKKVRVYQVMWEEENGPVPAGKVLHHACGNKGCVNPAHLLLMDPGKHVAMHFAAKRLPGCCIRGHPWDPSRRQCLPCMLLANKRWQERHPEEWAARKREYRKGYAARHPEAVRAAQKRYRERKKARKEAEKRLDPSDGGCRLQVRRSDGW